jgi:hypothetical protein
MTEHDARGARLTIKKVVPKARAEAESMLTRMTGRKAGRGGMAEQHWKTKPTIHELMRPPRIPYTDTEQSYIL